MPDPATWLSSIDEVCDLRAQLDALGQKLVFTNGCFDLLHVGHVRYLRQARALGDALIVGLNSDASVRALKGPTRPVNTQDDRAEILMALECVDGVLVFDEPRVTRLIEAIEPHIYTKGGDYTVDTLNPDERAALQRVEAEIAILPLVPGRSTTATLQRVQQGESSAPLLEEIIEPLRLGILGSGHGTNFLAIHHAIAEARLDAEIRVVISDVADSRILRKAREFGIEAEYVNPGPDARKLAAPAQEEINALLKSHDVQVVVLAGFMRVVKAPILTDFRNRIVNIHPSLLPKYKGKAAWKQALDEGEVETGCTVHLVNEEIDAGRILAQAKVPIHIGDTADDVYYRIQEQEHKLLPKVLAGWRALGLPVA
ncbi:MAG: phosphoribosylglycinamide formyltransferase [Roseimicrobium sp.]